MIKIVYIYNNIYFLEVHTFVASMNLLLSQIHASDDSDGVSPVKPKIMSSTINPNINNTTVTQLQQPIISESMNIGGEDMMKYINNIRSEGNNNNNKELDTNINLNPDIFLNPNNNNNNTNRIQLQKQQKQSFSYTNESQIPNIPLYNNYTTNNDVVIPTAPSIYIIIIIIL